MLVTVDEAKLYLRLDGTEEDALIQTLLETAESLCQDIVRTDFDEMEEVPEIVKVGIRYAVYFYNPVFLCGISSFRPASEFLLPHTVQQKFKHPSQLIKVCLFPVFI